MKELVDEPVGEVVLGEVQGDDVLQTPPHLIHPLVCYLVPDQFQCLHLLPLHSF